MQDSTPTSHAAGGPASRRETRRPARAGSPPGTLRTWWNAVVGGIGTAVGLAPHVLHHIGLLAGTALVTGAGGTAVFGVLGLIASVPLLLRLRRRFGSWWAPAVGLVVFAVMFTVSAFILGPAISRGATPGGGTPSPSVDHAGHHG